MTDEKAVCAQFGGRRRQLQSVFSVEGANAGEDLRPVADRIKHHAQQVRLLCVGGRWRLSGRTADHQSVVADLIDQIARESGRCVQVKDPSAANGVTIAVSSRPKGGVDMPVITRAP